MTRDEEKKELLKDISSFIDSLSIAVPLFQEYAKKLDLAYDKGVESVEREIDRNILDIDKRSLEFIKNYTYDLLKAANDDMVGKLKSLLSRSIVQDIPKSELVSNISKIMDVSKARAKLILDTERMRAYNFGRLSSAREDKEITKKYWVAILDGRTSPLCLRLSAKYREKTAIPLDQHFKDDLTGQRFLAPPGHPSCRSFLGLV